MISHAELVGRIAVGAVLGGVIGHERQIHGRPVGLRTHLLVAMAAATFMVVSEHFVYFQHYAKDDLVMVDPSRIAASVVTGIGFLAGGSIVRAGVTVQGLTTAAGLWLVTAVGLCSGGGMYVEAVSVTALGIVVLTVLRRLEHKEDGRVRRRILLVLGPDAPSVTAVLEVLRELGALVGDAEYTRRAAGQKRVSVEVRLPAKLGLDALVERLEREPGVRRVRVCG
jgi:putative Mg2+ transporter-C (MgtC) family protein